MFETVVIATDGSDEVGRAIDVGAGFAERFDAAVHAVYVVDIGEVESSPERVRDDLREALVDEGRETLRETANAIGRPVTTAIREGRPPDEIAAYARQQDADVVVTGTRGRHGENRLLVGSVAERLVRTCPVPVLTVRHLGS